MKRLSVATAFAVILAASLGAGAAAAQTPAEARSVAVGYLDLDLASTSGRATLERRVRNAVNQVCGKRPSPKEMVRGEIHRTCVFETQEEARQQMAKLFGSGAVAENTIRVGSPNR